MRITVLIPVYNLQKVRDAERLHFSILSLLQQTRRPVEIIVSDGSEPELAEEIKAICDRHERTRHIHTPTPEFNKPKLLNVATRRSNTEYLLATDADYLFSPGILEMSEKLTRPDRMILHKAQVMPRREITENQVARWHFGQFPDFEFGLWACGAFQLFHRDWFEASGGYDERMQGHGGMDHDFRDRCDRAKGFHVHWMKQGQILHQWHPVSKAKTNDQKKQFQSNIHLANSDKSIKRNA